MRKEDFIAKNPLRILIPENGPKRMGLVMARAGQGKTAILVQIGLDSLLRGERVLHVSIGQSLEKTRTWYDDIFKDMVGSAALENAADIHGDIQRNRLIMTFMEAGFSQAKFEERLHDLVSQNIFRPDCVIVDGIDFATMEREELAGLRQVIADKGLQAWFSGRCHRDDSQESEVEIPTSCRDHGELFDIAIFLRMDPEKKNLVLTMVKDDSGATKPGNILHLDPVTLMINP
jgi:hypothetical protein